MFSYGFAEGQSDRANGDAHAELILAEDGADYVAGYEAGWNAS